MNTSNDVIHPHDLSVALLHARSQPANRRCHPPPLRMTEPPTVRFTPSANAGQHLPTPCQASGNTQRRLFHHIAIGADHENLAVRAAADRLRDQLLSGSGVAQTNLSCDEEVDFGRRQIALTREGGPLAEDSKKVKLTQVLADVEKATEALAQALGRGTGEKRKAPSKQIRDAVSECAAAFTGVHDDIAWFIGKTTPGAERDRLTALLAPLDALLARNERAPATEPPASPQDTPAKPE